MLKLKQLSILFALASVLLSCEPKFDDKPSTNYISTPTGVTAIASLSSITVSWSSVYGATDYYIYRATSSSGSYTHRGSSISTSYTDTGLSANTTYYYRVSAYNSYYRESAQSSYVYATSGSAPNTPTGVTATASLSSITVSWSSVYGATDYYIYRATSSSSSYSYVGASTSTSYTNTGLPENTTYYYKVSAYNSYGESAMSSYVYATSGSAPNAPTGVTATAASSSSITVSWYSASGATDYYVYRATNSSDSYTYRGSSTSTSYTDTDLSANTTYYYKVSAYNSYGESAQSSYNYATTPPPMPPTPIVGSSLTQGVWTNDSPPYGVARYYYFYATSGISYTVFWNDDYQGDGTKTGSFGVSAYWYSDSVDIFSNQSYGYTYGRTFTASRTGYIMLKVEPLSYYDSIYKVYRYRSGTFAIAYQ